MAAKKEEPKELYVIFARKFRPQAFEEVVGQNAITTTLRNAIAKNRIAQSFLFSGPRGVGKTSTARILAKALNCEKGPAEEPCNKCTACTEITSGSSLDVLEIDGASNRGIEEIRSLRDNVKFKPASGRFKVYIIDEVHMLTGEAFNALLKTLEEPPAHVKFIFATTEVHKVPLTILSRCQRFNFKRISSEEIAKKLKEITKKEKIKASDNALFMIAKSAEGSLRDAESLMDQLASFTEGEIKEEDVSFSLGAASEDVYFSLLESLKKRDSAAVLKTVHTLLSEGADLVQFSHGLLELFRDLLVCQIGASGEGLIEGTEERHAKLEKSKKDFTREELFFALSILQQLVRDIRWARTPKFLVEAALLKIANRSDLKPIAAVIDELKSFQNKMPPPSRTADAVSNKTVPSMPQAEKKPSYLKKPESYSASYEAPNETAQKKFSVETEAKTAGAVMIETEEIEETPLETTPTEPVKSEGRKSSGLTINDVGRVWPELLEKIKAMKMSAGTYLSESEPAEVIDNLVVFGFPATLKFHKESLEKKDNKELIRSTLSTLLGEMVQVSFVIAQIEGQQIQSVKKPEPLSSKEHDIITSALDMFQGSRVIYRDV